MNPKVWVHWKKKKKLTKNKNKQKKPTTNLHMLWPLPQCLAQKNRKIDWGVQGVQQCAPTRNGQSRRKVITRALRTGFFVETTEKPTSENKKILHQLTNEQNLYFKWVWRWQGCVPWGAVTLKVLQVPYLPAPQRVGVWIDHNNRAQQLKVTQTLFLNCNVPTLVLHVFVIKQLEQFPRIQTTVGLWCLE